MKYVFASIYTIWVILSGNTFFNVEIPGEYNVTNTWERNGVLTVADKYGNGADIYLVRGVDFDEEYQSVRNEWGRMLINQPQEIENGLVFTVEVTEKINPVKKIILMDKDSFLVKSCLYETAASHSHGAFESDVITMLKSIKKGESYENAWKKFLHDLLHHADVGGGEG